MTTKAFLSKILFLFIAIQLNGQSLHNTPHDGPKTHGMLLFGQEKIYISHLPMFRNPECEPPKCNPHNYQVIMEIEISTADKKAYLQDIAKNPKTKYYTLDPEPFVLADMIEKPKPFKATIHRGHFERNDPPQMILEGINVTIKQVIYKKRFDDKPQPLNTSNYLLFGNEKEQYAAHLINKRPDFDDIRLIKASLPKDKIVTEVILDTKKNTPLSSKTPNVIGKTKDGQPITVTLMKQLYLEIEELK